MNLHDLVSKYPVDKQAVEQHKQCLRQDIAAYQLQQLRQKNHLSQKQLAEKLQVSQNAVSKLETRDLHQVKIGTLARFAAALGQPLSLQIGQEKIQLT